ncbi:MAG: tetratricopeptide repeat protein, partial [Candidatus Hodarchaeota archaeon]
MNDQEKPEELIFAEQLISKNKYTEAVQVLIELGKKKIISLNHKVLCLILQARTLWWLGKYEDSIKIAEKAYEESLRLGNNLQAVEALNLMALVNNWQGRFDKSYEIIKKSEELFKTLTKESTIDYFRAEAQLDFFKGFLVSRNDVNRGLEYLKYSVSLWDKTDFPLGKAMTIMCIGSTLYASKGELDQSIKHFEQALKITMDINNKFGTAFLLVLLGFSYSTKGDINRSLNFYQKSLKLFTEINNKPQIAALHNAIGDLMRDKGDFDQALKYIEKSLAIYEELGSSYLIHFLSPLGTAIETSIEKGDITLANEYLQRKKQINKQFNYPLQDLWISYYESLILKRNPRTRDKAKAEELLKAILEKSGKGEYFELTIKVLVQLCDLYLTELRTTNNLDVLEDINPIINRLLNIAKNSHSYSILCQTYIFQAKLALLTKDIILARQFLTQAQDLAEKYDLNLLAMKISDEHDELLKQLSMWEKLKDTDISIDQLMKEVRLDDQMKSMIRKHVESQEPQNEQPVLLTIISKEGYMVFSNPFTADMTFDADRIGDFLSSFNTLSDQIFYENLDRVKFIDYTILMKAFDSLTISYIFKGKSYYAQQKLTHFFEAMKKNTSITKTLNSAIQNKQILGIKEIPLIEDLITESFLSDPKTFQVPFKAYDGEKPFLFVSYAHVDKLHVYPIIDYLNKAGINIWYDEGIPISENWKKVIVENIEKCNAFLVFITPQILNSEYVQKEINFALKRQKPFFPVYLKETK